MAFRSWGRGRGRGGGRRAKELHFDLFPEIEGLGVAKFSAEKKQLIMWSSDLQRHWKSSPYYYVDPKDRMQGLAKLQKPDIERFSDKETLITKDKSELRDFILLDPDHIPAELAEGGRKRKRKKIQWNTKTDQDDFFEKMEKLYEENGETEKKENEDEEEEEEGDENAEDGEISDEGDYEENIDFDDDEDEYNVVEEDDEPIY